MCYEDLPSLKATGLPMTPGISEAGWRTSMSKMMTTRLGEEIITQLINDKHRVYLHPCVKCAIGYKEEEVVFEEKCVPPILQCVGDMSLQQTDAVWGQFALLSHAVELSGEHESCQSVNKVKMRKDRAANNQ